MLYGIILLIGLCNVVCSTFSYAMDKLGTYLDSQETKYVEYLSKKIEGGELEVEPYVVGNGERLWNIAKSYQNEKDFDITLDYFVDVVKHVNEAMDIDTSVLHPGDVIYLPTSIEGIV